MELGTSPSNAFDLSDISVHIECKQKLWAKTMQTPQTGKTSRMVIGGAILNDKT